MNRKTMVVALLLGCGSPPAGTSAPGRTPTFIPAPPAWGTGCVASDERELAGTLFTRPIGKRNHGVWLKDDGDKEWIVAYRATEDWQPYVGKRLRVRGGPCAKQGQALMAPHYAVESILLE